MQVISSYNTDLKLRAESSSGGVFSLLASHVISEGGTVYGAAFDKQWRVAHKRVTTPYELQILRGSKYVYSHIGDIHQQVMADLSDGRKVLFSGTPCQVAAMAKIAGNHNNLLLVEVVCHGAPEPSYWDRYLTELLAQQGRSRTDIKSVNFRDKRNGWRKYNFTIRYNDGSEYTEFHGANLYLAGFLRNYTLRSACFKCPFKYPDGSKADITLGDFWGIEKLTEISNDEVAKGISLIICHSDKGRAAIPDEAIARSFTFQEVAPLNKALTKCASRPADYDKFRRKAAATDSLCSVLNKFTREPLMLRIKVNVARLLSRLGIKK